MQFFTLLQHAVEQGEAETVWVKGTHLYEKAGNFYTCSVRALCLPLNYLFQHISPQIPKITKTVKSTPSLCPRRCLWSTLWSSMTAQDVPSRWAAPPSHPCPPPCWSRCTPEGRLRGAGAPAAAASPGLHYFIDSSQYLPA